MKLLEITQSSNKRRYTKTSFFDSDRKRCWKVRRKLRRKLRQRVCWKSCCRVVTGATQMIVAGGGGSLTVLDRVYDVFRSVSTSPNTPYMTYVT